jgi:hypothetical protein
MATSSLTVDLSRLPVDLDRRAGGGRDANVTGAMGIPTLDGLG